MRILIFLGIFLFFSSCKSDTNATSRPTIAVNQTKQKSKSKNPKRLKNSKRKRQSKAQSKYWNFISKELSVPANVYTNLKSSERKYQKQISALKRSKKWKGQKNKTIRLQILAQKENDLKKILGSKYNKWVTVNKKWQTLPK